MACYRNKPAAPYLPATYRNNLNIILAEPRRSGQGGQIEANFDGVYRCQARLRGLLYSFFASEIQKAIGEEAAEVLLRKAVLAYGRYRGERIRLRLERAGLPCDIEHLRKWWDHPLEGPAAPKEYKGPNIIDLLPHWTGYSELHCPIYDGMASVCPEVERLKIAYCEEVHRGVAVEVNPDIDVWYPALLPRGQGKCIWRYVMPKESARRAREIAERYREEAKADGRAKDLLEIGTRAPYRANATPAMCYEFEADRLILQYHFITDFLIRLVGFSKAYDIARETLQRWGQWRGQEMKEDHEARGWDLDVRNFITYHDDPSAGDSWIAESIVLTPEEHTRILRKSFYANRFDELGTGRLGVLFEGETTSSQARAYNPLIELTIPRLIEKGDDVSEFRFKLRGGNTQ